jgi:hypothetical protein
VLRLAARRADLGALSGPLAGLSFIAGIGGANALADGRYPRPGTEPAEVTRYFSSNTGPTRLSATGQAISAASLARFTVSVARLAGRAGPRSRALQVAAVAGGTVAAASLAASAACTAALSAHWGRQDNAAVVARRGFLAGGVIHTPAFGVLLCSLGLAGLRTGELPRPLALTELASGSVCLLAPLYLVSEPWAWSIPAGRFPGLVATGLAGARLASGRG